MAKNKTKFFAKRQPKLKVETLESRQLLAGVVGAGDEVASDVTVNGVTFDQVLLNGQSVTVDPDDGQWARLTWRDAQGEIIQAEFTGDGTISVDLSEGFSGPAEADRYNQPGVLYVGGNAQVLIEQSGSNTKLNIYSLGGATDLVVDPNDPFNFDATLNPFLDPAETYGTADIKNVKIVNDPNGAGDLFNFFGGGNILFNGSNGNVGFDAGQTNILNGLNIGGFDITNSAFGTLEIATDSQVGTVNIIGGNVNNAAGAFSDLGTYDVNFIDGVNASGDLDRAEVHNGAFGGREVFTIETATTYDFTGKSQAEIDDFSDGRTFINNITFTGDLPNNFAVSLAEARGNVVFEGEIEGAFAVDAGGIAGDLIFEKGITDDIDLGTGGVGGLFRVGSADNGANLGANVDGGIFNDIQVWGNLTGDFDIVQAGNVTITGNASGEINSEQGAGDVLVQGNVTGTTFLISNPVDTNTGTSRFGTFGSVTVEGDVDQGAGAISFIDVQDEGTFGPVSLLGGGGDDQIIGAINQTGDPGDSDDSSGSISITASDGKDVEMNGVTIDATNPGAVSVTGTSSDLFNVFGTFDADITATGFDDFTLEGTGDLNGATSITSSGGDGTLADLLGSADGSLSIVGFQDATIGDSTSGDAADLDGGTTIELDGTDDAGIVIQGDGAAGETIIDGLTASGFRTFTTDVDTQIDKDLVLTSIDTGSAAVGDSSSVIFADGFESGDVSAWSITTPGDNSHVDIGDSTIQGFTTNSLNITAADINIAGEIDIVKGLGNVNLTGDVVTSADGKFDVAEGAGDFTVTGKLTVTDGTSGTFLDLANGDLGSFTVTDKAQIDDALINLATDHDIGSLSFAEVEIDTANGALVTEADDIGSLTTSNKFVVVAGDFINADTLGDSTLDGDLTLPDGAQLVLDGDLGAFEVTGTASLENTGTGPTISAHNTGVLTFGVLDMSTSTGTTILVNDVDVAGDTGSDLDDIAGLTVNGRVIGGTGVTDIRASNIGPVNIVGAVAENEALVTDLNILATPSSHGKDATNDENINGNFIEKVALDGSNITDFGIGNVTIATTLSKAFTNTSLFDGDSSFIALGSIGNIALEGGTSGAQQSRLFADAATDGVWFAVGDGDGDLFNEDDELADAGHFGPDSTATADSSNVIVNASPDYTNGEVTIGNISINAKQTDFASNKSEVDGLSGDEATNANVRGFGVLAGVWSIDDNDDFGDLATSAGNDLDATTDNVAVVDAQLDGTVGTVEVTSTNAFGFLQHETTSTDIDTTAAAGFYSAIVAATEVGNLQGSSQDVTSGEGAVIGDTNGVADAVQAVVENSNQLIVLVV